MPFTPKPGLLTQRLDGEYVVFDPQSDTVHTLNVKAQLIWLHFLFGGPCPIPTEFFSS